MKQETTDKRKYIGKVRIQYDEQGNATSAEFLPAFNNVYNSIKDKLKNFNNLKKPEEIRLQTDAVFARWMTEANIIELDESSIVVSGNPQCVRRHNKTLLTCTISYYLMQKQEA